MKRRTLVAVATMLFASVVAIPPTSAQSDSEVYTQRTVVEDVDFEGRYTFESVEACPFPTPAGLDTQCGTITTPLNWTNNRDGRTVELQVAVVTPNVKPDGYNEAEPLINLVGGPGAGSTLPFTGLPWGEPFSTLVQERPVIMFTQRGSSLSSLDLECHEVTLARLASMGEDGGTTNRAGRPLSDLARNRLDDRQYFDRTRAAYEDCIERLNEEAREQTGRRADFSAYNTVSSAHDVEAIRLALGYEKWHVFGISYGTRLGQEVVRQHPAGVASLTLDSVLPPDRLQGTFAYLPTSADRAFDHLFSQCAADPVCGGVFPNLEERFYDLVAQANAEPFEFDVPNPFHNPNNPASSPLIPANYDGQDIINISFAALYNMNTLNTIPSLVASLEQGSTVALEQLAQLEVGLAFSFSWGMYSSVMCRDYRVGAPNRIWRDGMSDNVEINRTFDRDRTEARFVCPRLRTGSIPGSGHELVESDVPTLLMAGEFDPITPPSFAEDVASGFSNAQLVTVGNSSHGVSRQSSCGASIVDEFMRDPSGTVDQGCTDSIPGPVWIPTTG